MSSAVLALRGRKRLPGNRRCSSSMPQATFGRRRAGAGGTTCTAGLGAHFSNQQSALRGLIDPGRRANDPGMAPPGVGSSCQQR